MKKKVSDGASERQSPAIYLFHGDEYLVKAAARDLCISLAGSDSEKASVAVFDGASFDLGEFFNEIATPSLFAPDKVILVEQATLFVGKSNTDKLVSKACESWRNGDRKSAFRSFMLLCASAGIDLRNPDDDLSSIAQLTNSTESGRQLEILLEVATEFKNENFSVARIADDSLLLNFLSSPLPDGVTIIFTAIAIDKKNKLFKTIDKYGIVKEFKPAQEKYSSGLQKNYFNKLVFEFLDRHGYLIDPAALNKMYQRSSNDIRRIHSELAKVMVFIGNRNRITVKDVENLFSDFHEPLFFDFLTALRTCDPEKCLPALLDHLKIVAHPLQTVAAVASEFRKIIVAREILFTILRKDWKTNLTYNQFTALMIDIRSSHHTNSKKSKFDLLSMKDYPLYLLLKSAQNFNIEQLSMVMEAILEAEILIKSTRIGSVSPESVLQDLVLKICRISANKTSANLS